MGRKDEGTFEWDGAPLEDGDDISKDYEHGHRSREQLREDAATEIGLAVSGGGFVSDEHYDDGGFNAQNNP